MDDADRIARERRRRKKAGTIEVVAGEELRAGDPVVLLRRDDPTGAQRARLAPGARKVMRGEDPKK